ncbi:MAG TPA: lipopolysaccharide transport periplasmic protein LptA [Mariprofundaceae bacterium]|nr:lipopolysaccharide transport periplasmic protein LptA [Mariprofundaceae bacterium]
MRRFANHIIAGLVCACLWHSLAALAAEPVQIESDHLEIRHAKRQAIFTGHVHLTRGTFELFCDRLVAYYSKDGHGGIDQANAFGHVRMKQENKRGKSDKARLDNRRQILTLIGHAEMEDPDGKVKGSTIIHHIKTNETVVRQGETGRVQMHLDSKDTKKPEKKR